MTASTPDPFADERSWRPATRLVRGGTRRSEHGETSEALFLNSGFVYDRAETAEARFAGEAPHVRPVPALDEHGASLRAKFAA